MKTLHMKITERGKLFDYDNLECKDRIGFLKVRIARTGHVQSSKVKQVWEEGPGQDLGD